MSSDINKLLKVTLFYYDIAYERKGTERSEVGSPEVKKIKRTKKGRRKKFGLLFFPSRYVHTLKFF